MSAARGGWRDGTWHSFKVNKLARGHHFRGRDEFLLGLFPLHDSPRQELKKAVKDFQDCFSCSHSQRRK